MSKFAYVAIDPEGKEVRGVLEAESESEAIHEVGRLGLFLTEVHKAGIADGLRQEFKGLVEADRQRRQREEEKRQSERRKKHPRQRLVVHFADGHVAYGISFHSNPKESTFHLDCTDVSGASTNERLTVEFRDIKAVFYVRSFDGKFNKHEPRPEVAAEGPELIVEFEDGENLRGHTTQNYRDDDPRFLLVPNDSNSNNISILVERAATVHVLTPKAYEAKAREEKVERAKEGAPSTLCQEETMGDFYFETRNYPGALQQYEEANKKEPNSARIKRKVMVTKYNIAMQYVKRRDYRTALVKMNEVLELDPRNEHALKKVKKLRKIMEHLEGERA